MNNLTNGAINFNHPKLQYSNEENTNSISKLTEWSRQSMLFPFNSTLYVCFVLYVCAPRFHSFWRVKPPGHWTNYNINQNSGGKWRIKNVWGGSTAAKMNEPTTTNTTKKLISHIHNWMHIIAIKHETKGKRFDDGGEMSWDNWK